MKVFSFIPCFLFFVIVCSQELERSCDREAFQMPTFYILHKGGYSILRQCPAGRFFVPRLCRCVARRLAMAPWPPVQTTQTSARAERRSPTTFLPVTIEERSHASPNISTVNPMVTNSFAVMGGGFNMQSSDLLENRDINFPVQRNRNRRLLQHRKDTSKPSQKSLSHSPSNTNREKLQSKKNKKNRKNKKKKQMRKTNNSQFLQDDQQRRISKNMIKDIPIQNLDPKKSTKKLQKNPFETSDKAPCNPYFRFVFDRTHLSEDKSVPSSPSKSIRFLGVAGSTGKTSAYFDGNASVTVWGMSYITFAPKFKFLIRFRLREDYPYEDEFYTLISDGACEGLGPQYSVTVNPVRREVHSFINLKNKEELDLLLPDVEMSKWVEVSLQGADGEIMLSTDNAHTTGNIGVSSINSSACSMEIGRKTPLSKGFVGFIDIVQFHNCF